MIEQNNPPITTHNAILRLKMNKKDRGLINDMRPIMVSMKPVHKIYDGV